MFDRYPLIRCFRSSANPPCTNKSNLLPLCPVQRNGAVTVTREAREKKGNGRVKGLAVPCLPGKETPLIKRLHPKTRDYRTKGVGFRGGNKSR